MPCPTVSGHFATDALGAKVDIAFWACRHDLIGRRLEMCSERAHNILKCYASRHSLAWFHSFCHIFCGGDLMVMCSVYLGPFFLMLVFVAMVVCPFVVMAVMMMKRFCDG